MRALRFTPFALVLVMFAAEPVRAQDLIVSVSSDHVTVTSNYTGDELALFGVIERSKTPVPADYDIVVTVRGPASNMVTRRKQRTLGIWINRDSREFVGVPSYLGVFTNRPIDQIADADIQRRQQIGLNNIQLIQHIGVDYADVVASDPFRAAFIKLQTERQLYQEAPNAVTFITPTVFRATIPLPGEVPTGNYAIDVKLLSHGQPLARAQTAFEIEKVGFEQFVAQSATQYPLLYGLATAMMAIAIGWLGSVVFRRD